MSITTTQIIIKSESVEKKLDKLFDRKTQKLELARLELVKNKDAIFAKIAKKKAKKK